MTESYQVEVVYAKIIERKGKADKFLAIHQAGVMLPGLTSESEKHQFTYLTQIHESHVGQQAAKFKGITDVTESSVRNFKTLQVNKSI